MSRRVSLPTLAVRPSRADVVDVLTGEAPLVPPVPDGPLSLEAAQALTARIRQAAREVGERVARLLQLVEQAIEGEAWVALGYPSWTAYLADTLEPMRLPVDERRQVVGWLTGRGMSTRAIAPIVSVDQKTVSNDRRALAGVPAAAREEDSSPAALVLGLDGKEYPAAPVRRPALVVVPPAQPATADRARQLAARALASERSDGTTPLLWPRIGAYHAAATLERAADRAARAAARALAGGDGLGDARVWAEAYMLLAGRAGTALSASTARERAGSALASTNVG